MHVTINGREVQAQGTVLQACRQAGAAVPTLCHDSRIPAGGHCRACMVEMEGRLVPACSTPVRAGAHIHTDSARVLDYRRDLGELMASECQPQGQAQQMMQQWGVQGDRYRALPRQHRQDASHPYLRLDMQACVMCRLCLEVCADVQGQFVFAVAGRGCSSHMSWGSTSFADTDCVSCGACASVCPSQAISDIDRQKAGTLPLERVVRSTCSYCGVGCQLDAYVAGDDVVRIEGAPSPVNHGHLCVKGRYAHNFTRHPDRLTTPLLRRHGRLEPVSWEEALAFVGSEFQRLRGHLGGLSSSRCSNEENFLVQKWMRAGLGTNNVDCCARVCHAPTAAGMRHSFGTGAATNSLADIERADLLMVFGSNATESHPITGARLKQAVLRGARLLVVDPRRTELAALADIHLQCRPGTNVPTLNSMAAVLVQEDLVDHAFLQQRTEGWEEFRRFILAFLPEQMESVTGLPASQVRRAAHLYAQARSPMQVHGLGMTEHLQGSEGVMLLCNLALLRGAVGREGVGVNPLRGQNNVQGAADMGCQPDSLTGYQNPTLPQVRQRFEQEWARPLPQQPGLTLPRMYEAIDRGEVKGLFILGEDVIQTDPDSDRLQTRLESLECLVVQEIFLSETARLAHLVLPGSSFLEKDGTFTNGERRIQRVRKALDPPGQARADWEILVALMKATGLSLPYTHPSQIFAEICRLNPAFAGATWEALEEQGLQWPVTAAAPTGTPILHRQNFSGGKAQLACVDYLPSPAQNAPEPLRLITGRVLEHYNSGTMTRRSRNVELVAHDYLEIHPQDAQARALQNGDEVVVQSQFGEARAVARVTDSVAPGTLFLSFHFPESHTNRVTSDVMDRLADCPEYKLTAVEVRRAPPEP